MSRWIAAVRSRATTDPSDPADSEQSLSKSEIFDVLRNQRRRAVIRFLSDNGGCAPMDELTEAVAACEFDKPVSELTSTEYKRVYTGLYQCHLERMEELGVIAFDRAGQTVELRAAATQVSRYLPGGTSPEWPRAEAAVIGLATAVIALGILETGPLGTVSPAVWTLSTVVLLLGLAFAHLLEQQPM